VVGDDGRPQQLPWEDWTDIDDVAPLTSAWMRATAPSGSAAYEGRVQWAGELGFGVRPAENGQSVPETEADTAEADTIFSHPGEPGGHDAAHAPAGSEGHGEGGRD
jgi:NADH-quinone oxidoreductase subunit I